MGWEWDGVGWEWDGEAEMLGCWVLCWVARAAGAGGQTQLMRRAVPVMSPVPLSPFHWQQWQLQPNPRDICRDRCYFCAPRHRLSYAQECCGGSLIITI